MADMLIESPDGTTRIQAHEDGVWQCTCGSQFFYLNEDGTVSCVSPSCQKTPPGITWTRGRVS